MNEETNTTGYDQYFTETTEGLDIVANNIEANCITSTNNKFSLDTNGNLTVNSLNISDANNNTLSFEAIFNRIYPVGSIYITTSDVNPGTLFTGTWEKIEDRFLLASSNNYSLNSIGGALTHNHPSSAHSHTSAAHSHGYGSLYTAARFAGTNGFYYKTKIGIEFTGNERKKDTGAGVSTSSTRTEGIQVYGNTGSTTPSNTGSTTPPNTGNASSLPPYLAVNIYKRVS
ncbi:MAG: phage baseplate protein [Candidatus Coprovivens sp.]